MVNVEDKPIPFRLNKMLIYRAMVLSLAIIGVIGLLIPENLRMPVDGARSNDWNHQSFWYHPWGRSGVHKGIDIFATKGRKIMSSTPGYVLSSGEGPRSGKYMLVLGPKWRVHYYAHMNTITKPDGRFIKSGTQIGTVGDTGNATGKAPHLHYTIATLIPYPWRINLGPQGWKRMFFLSPHERLIKLF